MKANKKAINFRDDDNAMVGAAIGAVVALLVSILVGILVYYKVANSAYNGIGNSDLSSGGKLARTAINQTNTSSGTVFTLAPIVGIVLIAGIILAIVTRFGQGPSI
jgi:hypothetical protein